MRKILYIALFLITTTIYSDIEFVKFIKAPASKKHAGYRKGFFILKDTETGKKKVGILDKLPDNTLQAKQKVLDRLQELWDEGRHFDDSATQIDSPAKDFLDNLPSLDSALSYIDNNFQSLTPTDRNILKKMVKAIFALKELE